MPAPRLTPVAATTDAALVLGLAARLTRLVTTDAIGDRYVRRPVEAWALDQAKGAPEQVYLDGTRKESTAEFLADGLSCPYCWGFWATAAATTSYLLARRGPRTLALWRAIAAPFAASYVVGHVSARLDD